MRRTASDPRCGSCVGIVAEGSCNIGHRGLRPFFSVIQMSIAISQRTSWSAEGKWVGASRLPSAEVRSIRASLTRRTRSSSSSASAATRACSRVMASVLRPAILRARPSTCFANAALDGFKLRPWLRAFRLARVFPAPERGPVLLPAFRRFAAICRSLATVKPTSCRQNFRGEPHHCFRFQGSDLNSAAPAWQNRPGNRRR